MVGIFSRVWTCYRPKYMQVPNTYEVLNTYSSKHTGKETPYERHLKQWIFVRWKSEINKFWREILFTCFLPENTYKFFVHDIKYIWHLIQVVQNTCGAKYTWHQINMVTNAWSANYIWHQIHAVPNAYGDQVNTTLNAYRNKYHRKIVIGGLSSPRWRNEISFGGSQHLHVLLEIKF